MNGIKRILVFCRMVGHCEPVVKAAAAQARKFGAKLYVMHVIHDPFGVAGWNLPLPSLSADYLRLMERTKKELDAIVTEIKSTEMEVAEVMREGRPVNEVRRFINEEKIDLLVLPAHAESRLEHFLFGGDNEELVRAMPCSVLLVKREPRPVTDEELVREHHPTLATWGT